MIIFIEFVLVLSACVAKEEQAGFDVSLLYCLREEQQRLVRLLPRKILR